MIARQSHRRFANAKDFQLFRNGKPVGTVGINEADKTEERRQLQEAVKMSRADKVLLVWTAREGKCRKEILI